MRPTLTYKQATEYRATLNKLLKALDAGHLVSLNVDYAIDDGAIIEEKLFVNRLPVLSLSQ